ncbi:hypothetical protein AOLI_G00314460 [Acnodon oligacanthus]
MQSPPPPSMGQFYSHKPTSRKPNLAAGVLSNPFPSCSTKPRNSPGEMQPYDHVAQSRTSSAKSDPSHTQTSHHLRSLPSDPRQDLLSGHSGCRQASPPQMLPIKNENNASRNAPDPSGSIAFQKSSISVTARAARPPSAGESGSACHDCWGTDMSELDKHSTASLTTEGLTIESGASSSRRASPALSAYQCCRQTSPLTARATAEMNTRVKLRCGSELCWFE